MSASEHPPAQPETIKLRTPVKRENDGPALFRCIGLTMQRITELCARKKIPQTDPRYYSARYLADGTSSVTRDDEKLESPRTVGILQERLSELQLWELALRDEPAYIVEREGRIIQTDTEDTAFQRVRQNAKDSKQKILPLLRECEPERKTAA